MKRLVLAALLGAVFLCSQASANDNYDHVLQPIYVSPKAAKPPNGETVYALNGLGTYFTPGAVGPISRELESRGYSVTIMPHTRGKWLQQNPDVYICHSMGCNAALKAAARIAGKKPRLIVSVDPGRAPLFHRCTKGVRCVNFYDPRHLIGGQYVVGAKNIVVPGTIHSGMPRYRNVIEMVVAEVVRT